MSLNDLPPPLTTAKDILEGAAATYWIGKMASGDPHHVDLEDSKKRIVPTVKVHSRAEHATIFAGMWGAANVAWHIVGIPIYFVLMTIGVFATAAWCTPILALSALEHHQYIPPHTQALIVAMIIGVMLISTLLMRPKGKWVGWTWGTAILITIISIAGFLSHVAPDMYLDAGMFHSFGIVYGFLGFWLFISWVKVIAWPLIKLPFKWLINHGPAISYGEGYAGPLGGVRHNHPSAPEPVFRSAQTYEPSQQIPRQT